MWKIEIRNKKQEWVNFKLENLLPSQRINVEIHARDGRKWVQPITPQRTFYLGWDGSRFSGSSDYLKLKNKYPDILESFIKLLVVERLYDLPVGYCDTFK